MNDILFRSATEIAALLSSGRLSASELAEMLFERVDAVNPGLSAWS